MIRTNAKSPSKGKPHHLSVAGDTAEPIVSSIENPSQAMKYP